MNWEILSKLKKFTELEEIFEKIGNPLFKLENKQVYYMGNGFFISYTDRKFRIENLNREEYGDIGEYILSIYYFNDIYNIESFFKIDKNDYNFDDKIKQNCFEIYKDITSISKFKDMQEILRKNTDGIYYREGESRGLKNGEFEFKNKFISFGDYTFLYFGKSKLTILGGIELVLAEE